MKRILIVYNDMMIGGSTTSLLSILNHLDYKQYQVDLLLKSHQGELLGALPVEVNLLPRVFPKAQKIKIKKMLSPDLWRNYFKVRALRHEGKNIQALQLGDYDYACLSAKTNQEYDVAISFLEFWSTYYLASQVKGRRKIAWVHVDYIEAGFNPKIDYATYKKMDRIVVVANSCGESFIKTFPEYSSKVVCVENILSARVIKNLAMEPVDFKMDSNKINMTTVCRITFSHKGLDRGVESFRRLKEEGLDKDVCWYIIGDGPDYEKLKSMIKEYRLQDTIFLLGQKINPHKYIKNSSLFFLPSHYEGKPMAVTEAMMLGIPPVVAEYASASEQIENGVDGWILPNKDELIYQGLKEILGNRVLIEALQTNVRSRDYSNFSEINRVIDLIEGRL